MPVLMRLARRVARLPGMARPAAMAKRLLARRDPDGMYGEAYYGGGRGGRSGYERYDRDMSNSDFAAYLIWKHFDAKRTLEVGAAMGFLVESMREIGFDAFGTDVSAFAVENCSPAARPYMAKSDLRGAMPAADADYDLVIALETLEHIPPDQVGNAIAEMRRATRGWVLCTIPSFGHNEHGPDGFFSGKIRWDRLEHYESLPDDFQGPVPPDDLLLDEEGRPIEGHICIASFSWWTDRFAEVGLERCGEMERRLHIDIKDLGFTNLWDTYVFRVPGTELPPEALRDPTEAEALKTRWDLEARRPQPRCG